MYDAEQQRYGELGGDYFWFAGKRFLVWSLLLPCLQPLSKRLQILDLGCGPGYAFRELGQWGKIVGVDSSRFALMQCRRQGHESVSLLNSASYPLPFRSENFSLVVAFDVIEHLDDDLTALAECHRVLQPGGMLAITVPALQWLWGHHDDLYLHKRRYHLPGLHAKLIKAGFNPVRLTYCHSAFVAPLWMLRTVKKLRRRVKPSYDFILPPTWLNQWLTWFIESEAFFLKRWNMPWGASLIGIARKP